MGSGMVTGLDCPSADAVTPRIAVLTSPTIAARLKLQRHGKAKLTIRSKA
jgi:hypothetical protein